MIKNYRNQTLPSPSPCLPNMMLSELPVETNPYITQLVRYLAMVYVKCAAAPEINSSLLVLFQFFF